jgi:hypothetical protein
MPRGKLARLHTRSNTSFATSSKIPALEADPKIRQSSLKYLPAQLNHCRSVSSNLTQMCLYAAAQSVLVMRQPLPALSSTRNQAPVDDILAGNSSLLIPSFTLLPFGADRFKITLTEPFGFGRTIMPLIFAESGTAPAHTGPKAYPFLTHSATASVTCGPNS